MNRKGFTLIELLMVIVLIGILALILSPNIVSMINKNDKKSCESFKNNIISAAKMYVTEYKYDMKFTCPSSDSKSTATISLKEMVVSGYLNEPVINPKTNEEFTQDDLESISITATFDCENKSFVYSRDFSNFNC